MARKFSVFLIDDAWVFYISRHKIHIAGQAYICFIHKSVNIRNLFINNLLIKFRAVPWRLIDR